MELNKLLHRKLDRDLEGVNRQLSNINEQYYYVGYGPDIEEEIDSEKAPLESKISNLKKQHYTPILKKHLENCLSLGGYTARQTSDHSHIPIGLEYHLTQIRHGLINGDFSFSELFDLEEDLEYFEVMNTLILHGIRAGAYPVSDFMKGIDTGDLKTAIQRHEIDKGFSNRREAQSWAYFLYFGLLGRFVNTDYAQYYIDKGGQLIEISDRSKSFKSMVGALGVNVDRPEGRALINTINRAVNELPKSPVYTYSHYIPSVEPKIYTISDKGRKPAKLKNPIPNTGGQLYIDNGDGKLIRITAGKMEIVDNGYKGVIFNNSKISNPLLNGKTIGNKTEKQQAGRLDFIPELTAGIQSNYSKKELQTITELYLYSIFFKEILPTKPILIVTGCPGGGKSNYFKRLNIVSNRPATEGHTVITGRDQKDTEASFSNNIFTVLENFDNRNDKILDTIAVASTGGEIQSRELYTNNSLYQADMSSFVGVTTRNVKAFYRDDIISRSIILEFAAIEGRIPQNELNRRLIEMKNNTTGKILWNLQIIVGQLDKHKNKKIKCSIRMADWEDFARRATYGTSDYSTITAIMKKIKQGQCQTITEHSQFHRLMGEFLAVEMKDRDQSQGYTAKNLYQTLSNLSKELGISFEIDSSRKLPSALQAFSEESQIYNIQIENNGQQKIYSFTFV